MSTENTSNREPVSSVGSNNDAESPPKIDQKSERRRRRKLSLVGYAIATLIIWLGIFAFAYLVTLNQSLLFKAPEESEDWLDNAQAWGGAAGFASALISGFALGALIVTFVWQFRQASENQKEMSEATRQLEETANSLKTTAGLLSKAIDQLSVDAKTESLATIINALTTMIHESDSSGNRNNKHDEWVAGREKALSELQILVNNPSQTNSATTT